jgi:hypothetical protein
VSGFANSTRFEGHEDVLHQGFLHVSAWELRRDFRQRSKSGVFTSQNFRNDNFIGQKHDFAFADCKAEYNEKIEDEEKKVKIQGILEKNKRT